jgi:hypothetical protein
MAASQQYKYQAQVAEMNEKIARDNAKRATDRARIEQENFDRTQTAAMLGEQEHAMSGTGLSVTGRSFRQLRSSSRQIGRWDALNIQHAGAIESYNYLTQAANFKAEAEGAKASARNSMLGGFLGAAGNLVAGIPTGGGTTSLIGGAKSTAPPNYAPIPLPKPVMIA